jgi:hypothetical protein
MDREEAFGRCVCPACPSYLECETDKAFCIIGKSKCIKIEHGCICRGCPVFKALSLSTLYFCTRGAAQKPRK